jgi:Na+/melibiose symporter-like transporter
VAVPRTKEQALRQMRSMWFAFVVSIPLYIYAGCIVGRVSWLGFRSAGMIFIVLAALNLLAFSWALRKRYLPAKRTLKRQPENADAVKRWMSSWTIVLCNANSLIVLGFAFWMGGKTLRQSLPFFVFGSILILLLWPRQVWLSSTSATV